MSFVNTNAQTVARLCDPGQHSNLYNSQAFVKEVWGEKLRF